MKKLSTETTTQKLTACAMLIALNTVLSLIKVWDAPFGGSVTLFSMLPIAMASIMFGGTWGLGCGFISSLIQLALGLPSLMSWGLTPQIFIGALFLDYLLPFTFIGLAGIFRKKGYSGAVIGTALAVTLRFICHFISGVVLWTNLEKFIAFGKEWISHPIFYSLCYNGAYMLPELIITTAAAALIFRSKAIKQLIKI